MRHTARNIPPIALLTLAIILSWLSFTIFSVAERERLIADQIDRDRITLDRLQAQIEHSYRKKDFYWIQQSLGSLGANNDILRVSLTDESGKILADLNRSTLGLSLADTLVALNVEQADLQRTMLAASREHQRAEIFRSSDEGFIGAVYPVTLIDTGLNSNRGTLWMETDLRRKTALAQEQIKLQTIALMIGFTFLALCLGVLFHVVITRRINKLVSTMTRVADGELSARVDITSRDEFGWLGHYFNEMLDRRQSVERALRQSQKLESIGTLASGIAHDFNNILQAISGYVRLAQARVGNSDPDLARYLEKIDLGSVRATALVQRILSFSRSSDADFRPVRLQQVIKDSLALLETSIPHDIRMDLDIDPDCPTVFGDATQMQQVVSNLVTNAVHAVDQRTGSIALRLRRFVIDEPMTTLTGRLEPGAYAEFSIDDDGEGISAEHIDRLFDPFFTTKDVGHGTGLGLSIVHGVVKNTRGGLLIDAGKTQGTRILVLFPVSTDPTVEAKPAERPAQQGGASGPHRILLVDDEAEIGHSTALLLRELGHDVDIAISAEEAIELANQEYFDVAVLDYKMPGMNGFELAARLNEIRRLPVIIATGLLEDSKVTKGIPDAVFKIIRKPYDVNALTDIITDALATG